ncbi:Fic family protein [Corynebacterium sp.]|uniref:Fic family protein n=1 Tax=Corynebacterium sp. TaxID=1720 RepID=UPI0026041235|nr:Fic family protein [Corynebacterium sp.]
MNYETLDWVSSAEVREAMSRRAKEQMPKQYDSALVPRIAEVPLSLSTDTFAHLEQVALQVTRFDAEQSNAILPFTALLLRSESFASSRIEDLSSSARKIFEAEIEEYAGTKNAQLILANTRQMQEATKEPRVSVDGLLDMHRVLLEESAPEIAGKLRTEPVWIGGKNLYPEGALFVPPQHEHLPALMADLEEFCRRRDLPAIAHAAIAHAQLETIHPFADGNGRTGRALIHILLRNHGLTSNAALPISAGLLRNTEEYFDGLNAYREGRPEEIITLFADAALHAVERGSWLAQELEELDQQWRDLDIGRKDHSAWDLLGLLLHRPVLTAKMVSEELDLSDTRARSALRRLEEVGVLRSSASAVKGIRAWRAVEVLEILDEFAEGWVAVSSHSQHYLDIAKCVRGHTYHVTGERK